MSQTNIVPIKKSIGAPVGNSNASKNKVWSEAIRKAIVQRKLVNELVNVLIEQALSGDVEAIKEVFNRLEGRTVNGDRIYEWEE